MRKLLYLIIMIVLIGCSFTPSEQSIQTAIAETDAAKPTTTFTIIPSPTSTLTPTITNTPSKTPTKAPTATPRPSNTPEPGKFSSPALIGMTIRRNSGQNYKTFYTIDATVLNVLRGAEAETLARNDIGWLGFETPIEGQEYLAVQILYNVITAKENEPIAFYRGWQVALRYSENGSLFWPVNDLLWGDDNIKKYAPFDATVWVYFLVKKDTHPLLYFQPLLFPLNEGGGETSSGAYFSLN